MENDIGENFNMIVIGESGYFFHSNERFFENGIFNIFVKGREADSDTDIISLFDDFFDNFHFLIGKAAERVDIDTLIFEKVMYAENFIKPCQIVIGIGICLIDKCIISGIDHGTFFYFLFKVFVLNFFSGFGKRFGGYRTKLIFIHGIQHQFGKISFQGFFGIEFEFIGNFFCRKAH